MSDNNLFNIYNSPEALGVTLNKVQVKNTINSITGIYNCYSSIGRSIIDVVKNYGLSLKNLCSIFAIPITDALFIGIYQEDLVNLYNCVIHDVNNGLSNINQLFDSLNIPISTNLLEKSFYNNKAQVENIETVRVLLEKIIEFTRNIANMVINGGIIVSASTELCERVRTSGKEWDQARFERAMRGMTKENIERFHQLFNRVVNILQSGLKLLNLIVDLMIDYPLSELSVQALYIYHQNFSNLTNDDLKIQGLLLHTDIQSSEIVENKINSILKEIETEIKNSLNEITDFVKQTQLITEQTKKQINDDVKKWLDNSNRFFTNIKPKLTSFLNEIGTACAGSARIHAEDLQKTLNLEKKVVKKSEYSKEYGLAARPFTVKSLHIDGITFLPFLKRCWYV